MNQTIKRRHIDAPYISKSRLHYIEVDESIYLDPSYICDIFKIKSLSFYRECFRRNSNQGLFTIDVNRLFKDARIVPDHHYDLGFYGLLMIKKDFEIGLERLMTKADVADFLGVNLFTVGRFLTNKCPYYRFSFINKNFYRRVDVHYMLYHLSFYYDKLEVDASMKKILIDHDFKHEKLGATDEKEDGDRGRESPQTSHEE